MVEQRRLLDECRSAGGAGVATLVTSRGGPRGRRSLRICRRHAAETQISTVHKGGIVILIVVVTEIVVEMAVQLQRGE